MWTFSCCWLITAINTRAIYLNLTDQNCLTVSLLIKFILNWLVLKRFCTETTSFLDSCLRVIFHHRAVTAQKGFHKAGDTLYLVSRGFFAAWLWILHCGTHWFCDADIHAVYQAYAHTIKNHCGKKPLLRFSSFDVWSWGGGWQVWVISDKNILQKVK